MSANPIYAELDALQSQMQTIINQSQITSLESCKAHLQRCLDYLDNRDDCWDENIDKATDAIKTAMWKVQLQQEEIEDVARYARKSDAEEQLSMDWNQRVRDVKEHTR